MDMVTQSDYLAGMKIEKACSSLSQGHGDVAQAVLDKRNTFLYFKRTPFDFLVYIQRRVQRRPVADSTEVKRTKSTNEVNERC